MTFDNPVGYISICMQNFITIFHSVQEIGPFSLFQMLDFGIASTDDNCHFAISWVRSYQYQCVIKSLSKYSKRFKSYGHFSRTDFGRTHSFTNGPETDKGDYRTHSESQPSAFLSSTFSGSCKIYPVKK